MGAVDGGGCASVGDGLLHSCSDFAERSTTPSFAADHTNAVIRVYDKTGDLTKTRARGRAIINGNLFAALSVWYFYFKPNVAAHFAGWGTDDLTAGRAVATTYFIEK